MSTKRYLKVNTDAKDYVTLDVRAPDIAYIMNWESKAARVCIESDGKYIEIITFSGLGEIWELNQPVSLFVKAWIHPDEYTKVEKTFGITLTSK